MPILTRPSHYQTLSSFFYRHGGLLCMGRRLHTKKRSLLTGPFSFLFQTPMVLANLLDLLLLHAVLCLSRFFVLVHCRIRNGRARRVPRHLAPPCFPFPERWRASREKKHRPISLSVSLLPYSSSLKLTLNRQHSAPCKPPPNPYYLTLTNTMFSLLRLDVLFFFPNARTKTTSLSAWISAHLDS